MLSLNAFSQTVTNNPTTVRLQIDTARFVAQDLIEGDQLREERPILLDKITALEGKVTVLNDLNNNLRQQMGNYVSIISNKDKEIQLQNQIIKESDRALRKQKIKTAVYKVTTILGVASTLILAVL